MKKTVLFLCLASFAQAGYSADYSGTPSEGSKGEWRWLSEAAGRTLGNGLGLGVSFDTGTQCDSAYFAIFGNDGIDSIQLNIDGKKFSSMVTPVAGVASNGNAYVGYKLTSAVLRELKNGSSLSVETNKGNFVTSLSGSAYSFNMAYGNCMKAAGSTSRSVKAKPARASTYTPPVRQVQQQAPTYYQQEMTRMRQAAARDAENKRRRCKAGARGAYLGGLADKRSGNNWARNALRGAGAEAQYFSNCMNGYSQGGYNSNTQALQARINQLEQREKARRDREQFTPSMPSMPTPYTSLCTPGQVCP